MPKISIHEALFFELLGERCDDDTLERRLRSAKAELECSSFSVREDKEGGSLSPGGEVCDPVQRTRGQASCVREGAFDARLLKIELNDTNRPDLWSTAGLARLLRVHAGGASRAAQYRAFLSDRCTVRDSYGRCVVVDARLQTIRPFIAGFVARGTGLSEVRLWDLIQTQERLASNFGRRRCTLSLGCYRAQDICWPLAYRAVLLAEVSFTPLGMSMPLSGEQILTQHPKGREYGHLLKDYSFVPLLVDARGEVLSLIPITNSASLGAVVTGDTELFIECSGTDMCAVLVAVNSLACDLSDMGMQIEPVQITYSFDTPWGRSVTTPFYFQEKREVAHEQIDRLLGMPLPVADITEAFARMDCAVQVKQGTYVVEPAAYRNDFLHAVDLIEEVMLGRTLDRFSPQVPCSFTVGRLSDLTLLTRKIKHLLVGFGYQEMIFHYLGSAREFCTRMRCTADDLIEIENPLTESYRFVRRSIIPCILSAELKSAHALYPHRIFEIGKVAFCSPHGEHGTCTQQSLGFLNASQEASYNEVASLVSGLLYCLKLPYQVEEAQDPRFVLGRQASICVHGSRVGIFGEIHPQVLSNWDIRMPCFAGELDVGALLP